MAAEVASVVVTFVMVAVVVAVVVVAVAAVVEVASFDEADLSAGALPCCASLL